MILTVLGLAVLGLVPSPFRMPANRLIIFNFHTCSAARGHNSTRSGSTRVFFCAASFSYMWGNHELGWVQALALV